jgi:hypothetical protein
MTSDLTPLEIQLKELLSDDLYGSKDWRHADLIGRVEWLITMLANKNEEIDNWVNMIIDMKENANDKLQG